MKNIKEITAIMEYSNISMYKYKEKNKLCGYELNTYTDAGVNKILLIDFRGTELNPKNADHFIKLFNEYVDDINIEEEVMYLIDDKRYKLEIGLTVGLQDLKDWKTNLQSIFKQDGKTAQQRQFEQVKFQFQSLLEQMQEKLELMPTKGNSKDECQKINILHQLNKLDSCINGIELEDFIPNEYSKNFKLSYS